MTLFDYLHAPVVGFYYLAALTFATCVLHKAKTIPRKRGKIAGVLSLALLIGYLIEVLYYLSRSIADSNYTAPESATIRCLGSILVWIPLSSTIVRSDKLVWHPYFVAFVIQSTFETTICFLRGFALPREDRYRNIPLSVSAFRGLVSLLLVIDGFSILLHKTKEKGSDEEGQALLGAQANGATAANGSAPYGSINSSSGNGKDDTEDEDDGKEIRNKQAKRLEEKGGWFGYLGSFLVFIPYLWPRDDWKVMLALSIRLLHLLQGRVLTLLEPRQLGIITNKLTSGQRNMPWKDIFLWIFYRWFNSYGGFGIIDGFAETFISNAAFQRLTLLAYRPLMGLSMDFHTSKDSGEVLKAVEQSSSLTSLIELVLFELAPIIVDLFIAMYYVTHLFNAYMAFIILFMGLGYVWFGFYFTTLSQPRRRKYVENQRVESTTVNETVHNWQTIAYFNRNVYEADRYQSNIRKTIRSYYSYYFRSVGGRAAQDLLVTFGFASCCIFAISRIITGEKPIGNLITFIMYWSTLLSPLYMMSYSYRQISSCLIDAERLVQLLNTKATVTDHENALDLVVKSGKVEFKKVDFAYDPRKQIIANVSFTAEGGQTIAFVGETGGGKSTMLKLLFRFYDVTNGSIEIDGQDLRSVTLTSLREAMGLVPQDPALFNQTIRQNVRYAKLDATDTEIEDACRAASIHADIISFPDGYNSKVGERGVRLSGGQLQRIAIARVLLKDPKIVMLDEATSAIDSAIEAQIQEAFRGLSKGRTTFVIAHRLSTIMDADQILVVDKGSIIERGRHAELLELGGKYNELWTKQTSANHSAVPSKAPSTSESVRDQPLVDITPPSQDVSKPTAADDLPLIDITAPDGSTTTATGRSDLTGKDGSAGVGKRK